jgi:hypothetical protein
MKTLLAALVVVLAAGPAFAKGTSYPSAGQQKDMTQISQAELNRLHAEIDRLQRENEALKQDWARHPQASTEVPTRPRVAITVGEVKQVTPRFVDIRDAEGQTRRLMIDRQTQTTRDGDPVALGELQPGTNVRATYDLRGNAVRATQIELMPK